MSSAGAIGGSEGFFPMASDPFPTPESQVQEIHFSLPQSQTFHF